MMRKLVYCATPKKKIELLDKIMLFVIERGLAPLHPFLALPYKYFDDGYFQKEETMSYCLRLIQICDEVFVFGYSDGVEEEVNFAKKIGKRVIYVNEMKEWKEFSDI